MVLTLFSTEVRKQTMLHSMSMTTVRAVDARTALLFSGKTAALPEVATDMDSDVDMNLVGS